MAELRDHVNRLQQENGRLRTQLEADQGENTQGHTYPAPSVQPSKGKEPILLGDSDSPADDELSSGSSPLPHLSPPQNNTEAESRKRPPRHSSRFVSGMRRRTRREVGRDKHHSELAPENMLAWHGGMVPPLSFMYPTFGDAPTPCLVSFTAVRGPEDMLSSPLGQHILNYEPPRDFAMWPFSMCDGFSDPYDHMLHFNQAMILSTRNACLLCKVFPASLKGPALAWFHKLPRGSINSFSEL